MKNGGFEARDPARAVERERETVISELRAAA